MFTTRVLTFLWLFVPLTHSLNWDIVVGEAKRLDFYYNGTLTHTEDIPSAKFISSVTYDPVHYRVLFADCKDTNVTISSLDLSTRNVQPLVTSKSNGYDADDCDVSVVYDPVTQLLFWNVNENIYSFSLNPASSNKAVDGNHLFTLDEYGRRGIAVESCGGYIYWVTDYKIARARFDGSKREVLIDKHVFDRRSLAIDQQTQKMYWMEKIYLGNDEYQLSIESANFNGKNRKTLHNIVSNYALGYSLAVSKDFIYWKMSYQVGIWQLPKISSQHMDGKLFSMSSSNCLYCQRIAANYTIQEQIQGKKSCKALKNLIPNNSKPESTVSICQNYCLHGDCSVSAEGQPTCSCKAGYSGERCEVNACHKHCLNNGVCSLNEEGEAVCECSEDYVGVRCDVATTCTGAHAENTTPQVLLDLRREMKQMFTKEQKRMLQFFSDKINEYQAEI